MAGKNVSKTNNAELVLSIIVLIAFGLIMIYSASSYTAQISFNDPGYFVKRQAMFSALGLIAMFVFARFINYDWLCKLSGWGYLFGLALMIVTMAVGREVNGKKRWLGIGNFSFQPTELVKVILIVFLAVLIVKLGKSINTLKGSLIVWVPALIMAGLVAWNNLSSGIIIFMITLAMTYVATEIRWPYWIIMGFVVLLLLFRKPVGTFIVSLGVLKPYQVSRVLVWIEPEAHPLDGGYQVLQGLYAIGSGGVFGKGLGQSIQKLGFIPEAQNDMIFSIICEELGFIGALVLIFLYGFVIFKIAVVAVSVKNKKGKLICIGVATHIAIQVILNIAVVCNVIPNTGVTLPFISYGGTSIVFLLAEIGIVLNISNSINKEIAKARS